MSVFCFNFLRQIVGASSPMGWGTVETAELSRREEPVLSLSRERESVITGEEIYTPQFQIIIIIIIIIMFIFTIKIITSVFVSVSVSVSVLSLSMSSHPSDQFQKGHMCLRQLCIGL